MPQQGDDSSDQPVDLLPWVPGGVPPCLDFDIWSTPGDGTVQTLKQETRKSIKVLQEVMTIMEKQD